LKIYLGPAGVCVSSRERSTLGGLKRVAELGLNAMEVEFVRGVNMGLPLAKEVGALAKKLGVKLSVHAPYYVNLCSEDKIKVKASERRILDSVERAHAMSADAVVFHPGYYGELSKEEAFRRVEESCKRMREWMRERKISNVRLGLETTGKGKQFGTLDEIVEICKKVKGCTPAVDFAHIYARQGGKIDYRKVFDKVEELKLKRLHTHFSGIEFTAAGERRHLPMDKGPDFRPLAKELRKIRFDITIISESPVLEQDSLRMKEMLRK